MQTRTLEIGSRHGQNPSTGEKPSLLIEIQGRLQGNLINTTHQVIGHPPKQK